MPTYKFYCKKCNRGWEELQQMNDSHVSKCKKCGTECENIAFGGQGFRFGGRYMNKRLKGFPDHTAKVNKEADDNAEEMEKHHDQHLREQQRKAKK